MYSDGTVKSLKTSVLRIKIETSGGTGKVYLKFIRIRFVNEPLCKHWSV